MKVPPKQTENIIIPPTSRFNRGLWPSISFLLSFLMIVSEHGESWRDKHREWTQQLLSRCPLFDDFLFILVVMMIMMYPFGIGS
mmetsp:Transcript_25061/g.59146  ORF Transcript_25061/g.59146 Transcript_25061/m.59146 type:complete len:84 (-) Transcript_25061:35-286(-)